LTLYVKLSAYYSRIFLISKDQDVAKLIIMRHINIFLVKIKEWR